MWAVNSCAMNISTGKGRVPLIAVVAIMSISAIVSLPGLAVSPILSDLDALFPDAHRLEVEMLESLPSLMIIPFMLLAGRWSVRMSKMRLLVIGTSIFLISGVWCILSRTLVELIVASSLIGVGAGIIIPLSTGIIVDYFTGDSRVKMLGISSAVNNLTLVLATLAVGYLADANWHLAFAVYLLPAVTLMLIPALRRTPPTPEPDGGAQHRQTTLNRGVIMGLMLFYFAITYCSLVVTYNTSYIVTAAHLDNELSGTVISIFFLAIMAPGFVLNVIIRKLGRWVNMWSLMTMGAGLAVMALPNPSAVSLCVGALLAGAGYGVMQPIIYDKAATNAPPHLATWALAIVMAINYLAILLAPFIIDAFGVLFDDNAPTFAFLTNALITIVIAFAAVLFAPHSRVLGSDD